MCCKKSAILYYSCGHIKISYKSMEAYKTISLKNLVYTTVLLIFKKKKKKLELFFWDNTMNETQVPYYIS